MICPLENTLARLLEEHTDIKTAFSYMDEEMLRKLIVYDSSAT